VVGKTLSWLLRHNLTNFGVTIGATGFVSFQECVEKVRRLADLDVSVTELYYTVQNNAKNRFMLFPANLSSALDNPQGQIYVKVFHGQTDKKLKTCVPRVDTERVHLEHVVHGTNYENVRSIAEKGLMSGAPGQAPRVHIHFSPYGWGDSRPHAGAQLRSNADAFLVYDVAKMKSAGYEFLRSDNGVILVDAAVVGPIDASCLHEVYLRSGRVLWSSDWGSLAKDVLVVRTSKESDDVARTPQGSGGRPAKTVKLTPNVHFGGSTGSASAAATAPKPKGSGRGTDAPEPQGPGPVTKVPKWGAKVRPQSAPCRTL
jgi:RNA:NAD 2'-phosphotransferase (TPT1/KptA family)